MVKAAYLPDHAFRLKPWHPVGNFMLLPSIRGMARFTNGDSAKATALGFFLGDVACKLLRPFPNYSDQPFVADPASPLLRDMLDELAAVSPARHAFMARIAELVQIALNQPGRLLEIAGKIDALDNDRLTERAKHILARGRDPGANDLWSSLSAEAEQP